jgi:hypothetical protein
MLGEAEQRLAGVKATHVEDVVRDAICPSKRSVLGEADAERLPILTEPALGAPYLVALDRGRGAARLLGPSLAATNHPLTAWLFGHAILPLRQLLLHGSAGMAVWSRQAAAFPSGPTPLPVEQNPDGRLAPL